MTVLDERLAFDPGATSSLGKETPACARRCLVSALAGLVASRPRAFDRADGPGGAREPAQWSPLDATFGLRPQPCVPGAATRTGASLSVEPGANRLGGSGPEPGTAAPGLPRQQLDGAPAASLPGRLSPAGAGFSLHVAAAFESVGVCLEALPLCVDSRPGSREKNAIFCGKYGLCPPPPRSWPRTKPTCCSSRPCGQVGRVAASPHPCSFPGPTP